MKTREFLILAVAIILLGSYLFFRNSDRSQYSLPSISPLKSEAISRIEISASGNTVTLNRSGDQWQVGNKLYPADETKVKNILEELEGLKLTALVSEAKAYARYDLSDDKKISVKAWAGEQLVRNFEIGKNADTYQHTFIRLGDNPNVYHARNNFRRTFDQTIDTLRDKTALSFDTAKINSIEISSGDIRLVLSLGKQPEESLPQKAETESETDGEPSNEDTASIWLTEDGKPAPQEAVQRLLSQLAHLTCTGYLKEERTEELGFPVRTIILKGDQAYSLSIFEKKESDASYPATSSQNSYPFLLNDSTWTRLTESLDSIFGVEKKV